MNSEARIAAPRPSERRSSVSMRRISAPPRPRKLNRTHSGNPSEGEVPPSMVMISAPPKASTSAVSTLKVSARMAATTCALADRSRTKASSRIASALPRASGAPIAINATCSQTPRSSAPSTPVLKMYRSATVDSTVTSSKARSTALIVPRTALMGTRIALAVFAKPCIGSNAARDSGLMERAPILSRQDRGRTTSTR